MWMDADEDVYVSRLFFLLECECLFLNLDMAGGDTDVGGGGGEGGGCDDDDDDDNGSGGT